MLSVLTRFVAPLSVAILLSACTTPDPLTEEQIPMGNFRLGHNVVFSDKAVLGPLSRTADAGTWDEVLKDEVDRRFGRYEGEKLYHLGVSVDAYVLALPGIPIVASPNRFSS